MSFALRVGFLALLLAGSVAPIAGQVSLPPQGSAGSTWGGVALGAYSGTVFGLLGTMLPCNRTAAGARCAASGASAGAALGAAMGGIMGGQNQADVIARLRSAGWGAAVGAVLGLGAWKGIRQYGWADAVAVAAVGGAIGAAPRGAAIGAGVGVATGALVWVAFPRAGHADFALFTLGGLAVGGILDWAFGAADANRPVDPFLPTFSIPVGW